MAKRARTIGDMLVDELEEMLRSGEAFTEQNEAVQLQGMSYRIVTRHGKARVELTFSDDLNEATKRTLLEQELKHLRKSKMQRDIDFLERMARAIEELSAESNREADVSLSGVIIPERKEAEGVLLRSASAVWEEIVNKLKGNWDEAFTITDRVWEEIIAGAFVKAGFQEVVLTPRSGDHGRDVIARSRGVGCIKIIGSVKAYQRGRNVRYDDVRSLIGVMAAERDTSKGIITTTSDFPPRILRDPNIAPFVPYRLELMNGARLQRWLRNLIDGSDDE